MSKEKTPKYTTNNPQEFLKLKPWMEASFLRYDAEKQVAQIYLRSGMCDNTQAQRAYIAKTQVFEQIVSISLNDALMPTPKITISKDGDVVAFSASVDLADNHAKLASFEAIGEFKKTIHANERGDDEAQILSNLQVAFSAEWSIILSDVIAQAASYNEAVFFSKLSPSGAIAAPVQPLIAKQFTSFSTKKAPKVATSAPQGKPLYDSDKWPLWKIVVSVAALGLVLYAGSYAFTKLIPSAKKAEANVMQQGAISPDEIGKMVDQQKEAIANGGTDPYAGIDTGNVQIETLKRMGIDVGNTDLGCLASE